MASRRHSAWGWTGFVCTYHPNGEQVYHIGDRVGWCYECGRYVSIRRVHPPDSTHKFDGDRGEFSRCVDA